MYQSTPHPTHGKPPSMLLTNRKLRTHLDCIFLNKVAREDVPITRSFKVGDRVAAKDYLDRSKRRQFGTVIEKCGLLHYSIELDDGRIWKRHVNQLRAIGPNARDSNANIDIDCDIVGTRKKVKYLTNHRLVYINHRRS